MKVKIKLQPDLKPPYATIYIGKLTTEVRRTVIVLAEERADLVPAEENDRVVMLHPGEIYLARMGNERTIIYTTKKRHQSSRRLYELEGMLGRSFMRVSKSVIMNLQLLSYAVSGPSGVMVSILKSGLRDYVFRKYLPDLKRYLGL